MTSAARYTRTAIILHWAVATLILVNFALVWSVDSFGDDEVRHIIDMHKSIGLTVLGLVVLRVLWRLAHPPPPLPDYPRWQRQAAHMAHGSLYVLILAMPITGWLHDSAWNGAATHPLVLFGFIPWFRIGAIASLDPATKEHLHTVFHGVHGFIGYCILAVLALHVGAALKHEIEGHRELRRMTAG